MSDKGVSSKFIFQDDIVLNDKTISSDLVQNMIGLRFHKCLNDASKAEPHLADQLSDYELVHRICRKERLTFFNFLVETGGQSAEDVKSMLNREYGIYFLKKG